MSGPDRTATYLLDGVPALDHRNCWLSQKFIHHGPVLIRTAVGGPDPRAKFHARCTKAGVMLCTIGVLCSAIIRVAVSGHGNLTRLITYESSGTWHRDPRSVRGRRETAA
jgi:hypothetical protein